MPPRDFADSTMTCLMRVFRKSSSMKQADLSSCLTFSRDFVDTEHCTGDLNKMLLGSFIEEFDAEDEVIQSPPGTPNLGVLYGPSKPPPESQRTSPHNMGLHSDTARTYPRTSQTYHGNDPSSRRLDKQHKIPSFSYSGH